MEVARHVPQFSPSYYSHCMCPSRFPQGRNLLQTLLIVCHVVNWGSCALSDGWFCTSQEIWVTVHENPGCNITVLFTSFEGTRQQDADWGCQQSTELPERQDLPGGTRRAVPRPAITIERVVHVKIKTPDRLETSCVIVWRAVPRPSYHYRKSRRAASCRDESTRLIWSCSCFRNTVEPFKSHEHYLWDSTPDHFPPLHGILTMYLFMWLVSGQEQVW